MTASEFTTKAINMATKYKTLYVMGGGTEHLYTLRTKSDIRRTTHSTNSQNVFL